MHDDPPPGVEYLGDWDSPQQQPTRPAGSGGLLALSAAVVVVAVVVAIGLGGAQRRAADSVMPTTPTPTDTLNHYQVSTESPTMYQTIVVPDPSQPTLYQSVVLDSPEPTYSPPPLRSDAEADPVTVTLVDKEPQRAKGTVAYRVSVCVNSVALGGGKVRIQRDYWALGDDYSGSRAPVADSASAKPAFPENGVYGKGECATGYVTFAADLKDPIYLVYLDNRYGWYWRLN